ncbi:MAG: thioredoxin family protein [Roseibacillus sp.]
MKAILTTLALFLTATFATAANEDWSTDLKAAFAKAKKENKHVLVEFTGSDWCPPCKMMRKNVFSKKSFTSKASEDFILVELDYPRGDKALAKKNEPYAEKYKIEGFPTVILFNPKGKEYNRFYASEHPSIDKFLAHLKKVKK